MKLLVICVLLATLVATAQCFGSPPAEPSFRALEARARLEAGTASHGRAGVPYWQRAGHVLGPNGHIVWEYRYHIDPKTKEKVFREEDYQVFRDLTGCSTSKEELVDLTDIWFDHNGNHMFDPWEFQHILDCLPSALHYLALKFDVKPGDMLHKCNWTNEVGISAHGYIMSEHCLPTCAERQIAKLAVFHALQAGTCRPDYSKKHDPREIFGSDWKEAMGGSDQAMMDFYQLKWDPKYGPPGV
jgi:hypothetical protein